MSLGQSSTPLIIFRYCTSRRCVSRYICSNDQRRLPVICRPLKQSRKFGRRGGKIQRRHVKVLRRAQRKVGPLPYIQPLAKPHISRRSDEIGGIRRCNQLILATIVTNSQDYRTIFYIQPFWLGGSCAGRIWFTRSDSLPEARLGQGAI